MVIPGLFSSVESCSVMLSAISTPLLSTEEPVVAVMLLIALNLSRKYVAKMFNQSVKKTLRTEKGGSKS